MLRKHHISLFLSVTLVHPHDHQEVPKGTVIGREKFHGNPVKKDEVAIEVTMISGYDVVEAHCYVVNIERTDREQIRSRINNN